jgi:hypothetical protein
MSNLETLGFALGTSFASGLNVYATAAALGLLARLHVITLPEGLRGLAHPAVIAIAAGLYVVEFFADKIPVFDTLWDGIHTFIRPPAAALAAYSAFGGVPESWRLGAALLAGGVALTSHGTKATVRAAANASPEPFSNWLLSLTEDGVALGLAWMAAVHPYATAVVVAALLVLSLCLLVVLGRFLRSALGRLFGRTPASPSSGST